MYVHRMNTYLDNSPGALDASRGVGHPYQIDQKVQNECRPQEHKVIASPGRFESTALQKAVPIPVETEEYIEGYLKNDGGCVCERERDA